MKQILYVSVSPKGTEVIIYKYKSLWMVSVGKGVLLENIWSFYSLTHSSYGYLQKIKSRRSVSIPIGSTN